MAKYGTFLYGTRRYGEGDQVAADITTLNWTFIVNWDGTGYTGENEANRMTDLAMKRGRERVISPSGDGFEHYSPSQVSVELDNSDGRFDPFNTSSPLYPNVLPGKFCRVAVRDGAGTNYELMRGVITDIQPVLNDGQRMVRITAEDGLRWLAERRVHVGMTTVQDLDYIANKRILALANWPSSQPSSGTGVGEWPREGNATSKGLTYFWAWNENALDAIHWLEDISAGGVFFHQNNGQSRFLGANLTATTATISVDESELLRDSSIRQPWEVVRNDIRVVSYPKAQYANVETLWSLENPIYLGTGQTVTVEASLKEPGVGEAAAINLTSAALVFLANANEDGSGADLSANVQASFSDEFATGVFVSFHNSSAVSACWITAADINPPSEVHNLFTTTFTATDAASQALYGPKTLTIDAPFMQNSLYAQEVADYLLARFKDPQPYPIIKVENRPALQFLPDLYRYKFDLTLPTFNVSDTFRVGGIAHKWLRRSGQACVTTFWLEPVADVFVFT